VVVVDAVLYFSMIPASRSDNELNVIAHRFTPQLYPCKTEWKDLRFDKH
jgi:hypothetical protein